VVDRDFDHPGIRDGDRALSLPVGWYERIKASHQDHGRNLDCRCERADIEASKRCQGVRQFPIEQGHGRIGTGGPTEQVYGPPLDIRLVDRLASG
jgi:hypothetical protein